MAVHSMKQAGYSELQLPNPTAKRIAKARDMACVQLLYQTLLYIYMSTICPL